MKHWIFLKTWNFFENTKHIWGTWPKFWNFKLFGKHVQILKFRTFQKYGFLKIIKFGIFEFVLQKMNNFGICETFLKKGKQENMNLKKIQNIEKRNRKKMEQKTEKRKEIKQTQKKTGIKTKNQFREHSGRFTKPVACPSTHSLMQ